MQSNTFDKFWNDVVLHEFPKAKIRFKESSLFMKILSILVYPFNPEFSTRFITVIGTTVYFPSKKWFDENKVGAFRVITHEFVHMVDSKGDWLYPIKYLFPQCLGLFSLLAGLSFLSPIFLFYLCFLIFFLPFPAYWRTNYELNGYAMSLYIDSWLTGKTDKVYPIDKEAERFVQYFTSSQYYFMSWSKKSVLRGIIQRYAELPKRHEAFIKVVSWLRRTHPH